MAKSKASVILLSIAAIGIWGIVGYRVFRWVAPQDMPVTRATTPKAKPAGQRADSLMLNYRDPFFTGLEESSPTNHHPRSEPIGPEPVMPVLSYKGLIRDANGSVRALITSNGQTDGYKKGDSVAEVKIIDITADCLTVKWRGKSYTIAAQ